MTTVAFRAGVMAADTGLVNAGWKVSGGSKIRRIEINGEVILAGGSGSYSLFTRYLDWLENGCEGEEPDVDGDESNQSTIMIARRDADGKETIRIVDSNFGSHFIDAEYHAIGSGFPCALAAMFCDADAIKAVRAAMHVDPNTHGSVDAVSFD